MVYFCRPSTQFSRTCFNCVLRDKTQNTKYSEHGKVWRLKHWWMNHTYILYVHQYMILKGIIGITKSAIFPLQNLPMHSKQLYSDNIRLHSGSDWDQVLLGRQVTSTGTTISWQLSHVYLTERPTATNLASALPFAIAGGLVQADTK